MASNFLLRHELVCDDLRAFGFSRVDSPNPVASCSPEPHSGRGAEFTQITTFGIENIEVPSGVSMYGGIWVRAGGKGAIPLHPESIIRAQEHMPIGCRRGRLGHLLKQLRDAFSLPLPAYLRRQRQRLRLTAYGAQRRSVLTKKLSRNLAWVVLYT